jgi:hypothetical protein
VAAINNPVTFTCFISSFANSPVETVTWLLNGSTPEAPLPSGVITEPVPDAQSGPIGTLTFSKAQLEYNSTTIQCRVHLAHNNLLSDVTTLFLQGNFYYFFSCVHGLLII